MKFSEFKYVKEDGRIVQGVNTSPDVGVGQIPIEAAKLGNTVDKGGVPPTLSSKVKGKSTNVLYNLGLTESAILEKDGTISKETNIYVDMDGVLADFFGAWAKLMGTDSYRDIKDIEGGLQKIKDTDNFWLNLPLTSNAKSLLNVIKQVKGEYSICSTPLPGDPNSEPHKREWVKKHLSSFPPKEVIITSNKTKYATNADGSANILIDDYGVNIDAWEAAGGIGFKHKDHKFERTASAIKTQVQDDEQTVEGDLIPNPKNSFVTKSDTAYDFINIGKNLANLKDIGDGEGNVDEPDIMIAPYAGDKETKYLMKQLMRIGYDVQDADDDDDDAQYDENFADGKKPGRKGLAKRSGVNTKASVSSLRKTAKGSSGEKQRMAHWLANMKAGRKKKS
tara:strand:- start:1306 stop:2484 length:1179 start_codon:yes stop_codon:yes gene_type:complete